MELHLKNKKKLKWIGVNFASLVKDLKNSSFEHLKQTDSFLSGVFVYYYFERLLKDEDKYLKIYFDLLQKD